MKKPDFVVVSDWSKVAGKRVAYRVDVVRRIVVRWEPPDGGWTVANLVDRASTLGGKVLVLIDVAIGLPFGLFREMCETLGDPGLHFVDFLRAAPPGPWLGDVRRPEDWTIRTPYVHVPKGDGSLNAFRSKASEFGARLGRAIDVATGGRSPLVLSGIPGTVGSGSRDVIASLGRLNAKMAAIWPFDGGLDELLSGGRVVIGEIYPRSMYAHALLDHSSDQRCLLGLGKTKATVRNAAIDRLAGLRWHRDLGVLLDEELLGRAREDEDDFDAYSSVLAILRLLVENVHLEDETLRNTSNESGRPLIDGVAEGGMLGVLATQLNLKQRAFGAVAKAPLATDVGRRTGRAGPNPVGPWVRVTQGSLTYAANNLNSRQIAFSGLPKGFDQSPTWVEFECEGRPYVLTIGDATACWRSHQQATVDDFDALYAFLSNNPDQCFVVEIVEIGPTTEQNMLE